MAKRFLCILRDARMPLINVNVSASLLCMCGSVHMVERPWCACIYVHMYVSVCVLYTHLKFQQIHLFAAQCGGSNLLDRIVFLSSMFIFIF